MNLTDGIRRRRQTLGGGKTPPPPKQKCRVRRKAWLSVPPRRENIAVKKCRRRCQPQCTAEQNDAGYFSWAGILVPSERAGMGGRLRGWKILWSNLCIVSSVHLRTHSTKGSSRAAGAYRPSYHQANYEHCSLYHEANCQRRDKTISFNPCNINTAKRYLIIQLYNFFFVVVQSKLVLNGSMMLPRALLCRPHISQSCS